MWCWLEFKKQLNWYFDTHNRIGGREVPFKYTRLYISIRNNLTEIWSIIVPDQILLPTSEPEGVYP